MASARKLAPAVAALAAATLTVSAAGAAGASAPAAQRASVSSPTVLPSVIPSWATTDKVVGATDPNNEVFLLLNLKHKDVAAEDAFTTAVSTPGNALYRQYLTKEEYSDRFGPEAGAATAVTNALKTLGITSNVMTDKLGLSVMAGIPASLAGSIFGVRFQQVMHGGVSTRVAMNEPTLPASLVPYVSAVSGLTQMRVHLNQTTKIAVDPPVTPPTEPGLPASGAPTAFFNAQPASTFYGSNLATDKPSYPVLAGDSSTTKPYNPIGYGPAQIRGAYDVDKVTQTGKGITAGVVLFYDGPDVGADLVHYSTEFNLAAPNYLSVSEENQGVVITAGNAPIIAPASAEGEQTLDVEAIHLMAPDAKIVYSGAVAPEDGPIYVAEDTAIADGVQVINNSFGGVGDASAADVTAFKQSVTSIAVSMGVGLNFSSGDSGDEVTAEHKREGDFPTTSDQVTSVGGTGIEIGANNDYQGEFYWGTYTSPALAPGATTWGPFASQTSAGGGGLSTAFAEPTWQKGVVPDSETKNADTARDAGITTGISATLPGRVVPDMAMIADSTTGMLVGETQTPDVTSTGAVNAAQTTAYSHYRIGGTSVSSPIFTGMMALVDQALTAKAGKLTSAGFVNPTMYPFLAKHDGAFRDPQIGRVPGASRLGGTEAQSLTGCSADDDTVCTGTGPGVIPVVAEVRSDYTDNANNGMYTATYDPTGLQIIGSTPGDPVISHLRAEGVLGTLEDLPGYDDSTGLGSPDAPQFIADFVGGSAVVTPPSLPEVSSPVLLVIGGGLLGGIALAARRRRRFSAA